MALVIFNTPSKQIAIKEKQMASNLRVLVTNFRERGRGAKECKDVKRT